MISTTDCFEAASSRHYQKPIDIADVCGCVRQLRQTLLDSGVRGDGREPSLVPSFPCEHRIRKFANEMTGDQRTHIG